MKKLFTILLFWVISLSSFAEIIASGECGMNGDNITWVLDDDGTLTLSGSGKMNNYDEDFPTPPWYEYVDKIFKLSINEGVTSIGDYAFMDCNKLSIVTISNSVEHINNNAFYYCTNLSTVIMGNSIENIGDYVFYKCSGLTSVTIPNSVTSVGRNAFGYCKNLTSITIGNSVENIAGDAFWYCHKLKSVHISSLDNWCNINFATATSNPLAYAGHLFLDNEEIYDLIIPNTVTSIGNYTFCYGAGFNSITIPSSVKSIGNESFERCFPLVLTNNSLCYSENNWGCTLVDEIIDGMKIKDHQLVIYVGDTTSINIPNFITTIGDRAFVLYAELTSLTIPESVTNIEDGAFLGCYNLDEIYCQATEIPVTSKNVFDYIDKNNCKVYVPEASIEAYMSSEQWGKFVNILSLEEYEANKFKTDNADILNKTTDNVTSSDLDAINMALDDYANLSDTAKDKLTNGEKDLLDSLKEKAEELKAAEDADKKATEDANDFKNKYSDILNKDINDITPDDLTDINKALDDYNNLSDDAKDKLKDEKEDLDNKKDKAEEIASGLFSVNASGDDSYYYNQNGQRVNNNAKGIIIRNGKKMIKI